MLINSKEAKQSILIKSIKLGLRNEWLQRGLVLCVFTVYFLCGLCLYKDYGISTDEPDERISTFTNIKYAFDTFGIDKLQGTDGDLENYDYRYYGVAIQVPPALAERVVSPDGGVKIWQIRHLWTFLVCFSGYICFYLLCMEVFQSRWLSFLGTAMIALYPRFFAEQFYNIKDMMFVAVTMISMFVTVKLIESNYSLFWSILFPVVTALATNVRIVGAIFPALLLGFIWLTGALNKCHINTGEKVEHIFRTSVITIAGFFFSYIAFTPILWKHPIEETINVFTKFTNYDQWTGAIVYMGKIFTEKGIPWHYIPGWLLVALPIWYIVMLVVVVSVYIILIIQNIKNGNGLTFEKVYRHKYVIWATMIGFLPWIATVVAHSILYGGWRHFYFLLPPLTFVIISGLKLFLKKTHAKKLYGKTIFAICILGLLLQSGWIIRNHPFEMVYFNSVSNRFGDCFDRDYWHLSMVDLSRYILEHDDSEQITMHTPGSIFLRCLSEEERNRIVFEDDMPMYYIETYRGKLGSYDSMEGYQDYYSITVDGFRIATVFKKDEN